MAKPELPVIRTAYDGLGSNDPGVKCTKDEGKTIQSHKEFCDIDKQIALAGAGSILTGNAKTPLYGDFSQVPTSMHEAFYLSKQFEADFAKHKPEIRSRFDNNPAKMLEFLANPANLEESYALGLRVKPPKPTVPEETKPKQNEASAAEEAAGAPKK